MPDAQQVPLELEFAIFCIESVAARLGADAVRVYDALAINSDILDDYIIKHCDALHTQGKDYIVNDIIDVMHKEQRRSD